MPCAEHPYAPEVSGLCPACLLEGVIGSGAWLESDLVDADAAADAGFAQVTVYAPLGGTPDASSFLVREDRPGGRLLRLKRWRTPACAGFLHRFVGLRDRLDAWRHGGIARPLAAWLDDNDRPAVLSEFVQGISILQAVTSETVAPGRALELIHPLRDTLGAAHSAGLAHGSLVSGNVVVQPRTGAAYLLDFGMAAVCAPGLGHSASVSADRRHLAALLRTIRGSRS